MVFVLVLSKRFAIQLGCIVFMLFNSFALRVAGEVFMLENAPLPSQKNEQPVVYWSESWQNPRPIQLHFLRIDLSSPDYEVFTILADDPDGKGPAEGEVQTPIELANGFKAIAAINSNAFRQLTGIYNKNKQRGWFKRRARAVDISGLAVANGHVRSYSDSTFNDFWLDNDGIAHIGSSMYDDTILEGISDWKDRLLMDGDIVVCKDKKLHPRTLIGIENDGQHLLLVVVDGRQRGYSEGLSLYEAAALMKEKGCDDALNLDGGASSIMLISMENKLTLMNRPCNGNLRPLPVMLGVRQRIS